MMILFILLTFISGISIQLLLIKKINTSNILLFSFPIGLVFHTIIFLIFAVFKVLYNSTFFYIFSIGILLFCILLIIIKHKKFIFNNDCHFSFYFILFIGYLLIRLLMMSYTSFADFYNFDEYSAYLYYPNQIVNNLNFDGVSNIFSPLLYFIGCFVNSTGVINVAGVTRSVTPIIYILCILYLQFYLVKHGVNKNIANITSMLFAIGSSELLVSATTFNSGVYFMFYLFVGITMFVDYYYDNKLQGNYIISFIFLLGAIFSRREGIYLLLVFFIIFYLIKFIKKEINCSSFVKHSCLYVVLFIAVKLIVKNLYSGYFVLKSSNPVSSLGVMDRLIEKLSSGILSQHFSGLIEQFSFNGYYYFNFLVLIVIVIFIIIFVIILLKKIKSNDHLIYMDMFLLCFLYFGLIYATMLLLFTTYEFSLAASFSRYILNLYPIMISMIVMYLCKKENIIIAENITLKKIKNPKILIIIPAYNEEENILKTYKSIINSKKNYDVIVINDGSTDNTENILLKNNIPHIKLIRNLGIGGAVQTGYKYAYINNYDIAVQFDGDGQHDINHVETITKPIINGECDICIGSRFIIPNSKGFKSSRARRIGIKVISWFIKLFTGKKVYDPTSGFRAINKDIIKLFASTYPTEYPEPVSEVSLLKQGYIIKEESVVMHDRVAGVSSIHAWSNVYYMINVLLSMFIASIRRYK